MVDKLLPYIDGLHVLPWLTDGAIDFIDSHIFWLKTKKLTNPRVFEFGAGNSTLYFLSRGCYVHSVEHDKEWSKKIEKVSSSFGYENRLKMFRQDRPYNNMFSSSNVKFGFDLVLVDGRDRVECLRSILSTISLRDKDNPPIIILDNTERVSGKYSEYISLLSEFNLINFEMPFVFGATVTKPESIDGLNIPSDLPSNGLAANAYRDRAGNASKGRLITTIAVPKVLGEFTTQGIPLVDSQA